jgi:hypothetical protein
MKSDEPFDESIAPTIEKHKHKAIVPSSCCHKPGKFLGQCHSKYHERYSCTKYGEEISVRIENR